MAHTYIWFEFAFHANVRYGGLTMGQLNGEIHIVLFMLTC
jgi:hypothetical protein